MLRQSLEHHDEVNSPQEKHRKADKLRYGQTGYIVADLEHAAEAVAAVPSLDRSACREDIEQRFSHARMASDYVRVYRKILKLDAANER